MSKDAQLNGCDDVTKQAYIVLSSFKSGYGIDELLSEDIDKYWNSDGKAPHFMNIKFKQATKIVQICLNLNYEKDESYTPNRIILRAGHDEYSIVQVFEYDIVKPNGWISYKVSNDRDDICAFFYQLIFPYNYLNGKDLRIRGLRLIAKRSLNSPVDELHSIESEELFSDKYQYSPILR